MSNKDSIDLSCSRGRGSVPKAGSVWESRMKLDEVKGGIKVLIATHDDSEENINNTTENINTCVVNNSEVQLDKKANTMSAGKQIPVGVSGKRKTWKSQNSEGNPIQIAKHRSQLNKRSVKGSSDQDQFSAGNVESPVQLRNFEGNYELKKVKSELIEKSISHEFGGIEKRPVGIKKSKSDEDCREFGVCEDKAITSNLNDVGQTKTQFDGYLDDDDEEEEEDWDVEINEEIEVEKMSVDIKEISVQVKKPSKIVTEEKKLLLSNERTATFSPIVKKEAAPVVNHARINQNQTKTKPISDHFHGIPKTNSKLQSFVDLVMWRDVLKSAFVFGIGTFVIISSSYTKDISISFISVISYLGLLYLAAIFLFKSLNNRGSINMENMDQEYVVGEEVGIRLIKLVLPCVNEFLLKLRALFSGDPATTMKLAILLFILARCGSSITIWKIVNLGFFGVFTVPIVCSSYSSQLTAYGTFWIQRFGDAWESCSHKKAVGFAVFTLVWNLSSFVARIWAVFMLFVAFKYYQQSLIREGWVALAH